MRPRLSLIAALTFLLLSPGVVRAQAHEHENLGKLAFPTSCDPKVQAEFERGVAMLHSYCGDAAGARREVESMEALRAAADSEDGSVKHVTMENRLYPLRELLAELLLEMGTAAPALREFETRSKRTPTAIAASTALRARRRPRATGRRPRSISTSSSR